MCENKNMILNKIIKTNDWELLLNNETEIEPKMASDDEVLKKKSTNSNVNEMCIAVNKFEHSNNVIFKCFLNKTFLDLNLTPQTSHFTKDLNVILIKKCTSKIFLNSDEI